jgi:hypothetical protein
VTSYKIFSIDSSRVSRTHYRWPKIDLFPYQQSRTHIYAYPHHKHNIGTMGYLAKTDVQPTHLRPLGPLLVPTPRNLHRSLKAMIRLGQSEMLVFNHNGKKILSLYKYKCDEHLPRTLEWISNKNDTLY